MPRDPATPVDFRQALGRKLRVRWEGDQSLLSSLALVNRELGLGLLAAGDVELQLAEQRVPWHTLSESDDPRFGALFACRDRPLSGPPDVTVRHHFPPRWERPAHGKLVVMQPWEYGHLPEEWVRGALQADEVWAYSRPIRAIYVRSGVPAERVRIVPLGFNPAVLTPDGPAYSLPTEKPVRFLFVGGAIDRKGADLLLQAYLQAFTRDDPVCLVVKDMGTRTFYQGCTFGDWFQRVAGDPRAPELHYLDQDLSDAELAALYRACTCVVAPYRGEGFALAPLEGMACGKPAIITAGGPTDDYLDDPTALRVPARRRAAGQLTVGEQFRCVGDPWQLEPDLDALVEALRWVRDHPQETAARGRAAREYVADSWTWEQAVGTLRERLLQVVCPAAASPLVPAQPVQAPSAASRSRHGHNEASRAPAVPIVEALAPTAPQAELTASGGADSGSALRPSGRPTPRAKDPARKGAPGQPGALTSLSTATAGAETAAVAAGRVELSLCMIVRDEEPRIAECLRSIAPYVDEMVVVDTGSQDRTAELAAECGARVFRMPWPDSFAAARNESLAHARGAWIFWMDADDVIPPECGKALRELVRRHPDRNAAYQVQVRIPPGPGEFSPSVVDHVKLFPNRPDLRFEHRIHEQILPALRRAGLEVLPSPYWVEHRNYDRSARGQAKKRARDFRLLELDLEDHPDHPFVLFNLGMTYLHAAKEWEVAAQYLRRCLDRSHPADSIVRKAYAMLTTARICEGDWEAALQANEEGRSHYPDDAELLFQAGQLYQEVGRFAEGRLALERLVERDDDPQYRSVDTGLRTYRGRHELALLYRRMGDPEHCVRALKDLLALQPDYLPAQIDLVETLQGLGETAEARRILLRTPRVHGVAEDWDRLARVMGVDQPPATVTDHASARLALASEPLFRPRRFRFRGKEYPYFVHTYNGADSNERTVEVALALAALERHRAVGGDHAPPVLEVGHVLGHYGARGHTVVDKYERAAGVICCDIADYRPGERFGLILSVSTLEHVGWDGAEAAAGVDPEKPARVLRRLREELLLPGGELLLTAPLGHNPHLDRLLLAGETGTAIHFLRRVDRDNNWEEIDQEAVGMPRYGAPFPHGNVVAVLSLGRG